jgi:regulator of PEP synthase PpsR (kinase-PPPase family)
MKQFHIHLVSDSTGETVGSVARAALVQFENVEPEEHVWTLVRTKSQMERVIAGIEEHPGLVLFTLVDDELKDSIKKCCQRLKIPCLAVVAPVVAEISNYIGEKSHGKVGKQHQLDEDYFERVEAINFTLAHDDGQAHWELEDADVVLVGPSRTSKSPTCVYLAYRGLRAANVPYVMDCPLPESLFQLKNPLVVGLTISPDRLQQIRKTRLQSLKQEEETNYVDSENIQAEIEESRKLFRQQHWPIIDVSRRSVEETAATIQQYFQKHKEKMEAQDQ